MLKFKTVRGVDVPEEAKRLTRGKNGMMADWLDKEKENMVATLVYRKGKLIGWCAAIRTKFLWIHSKSVEIGTFVQPMYRGKGIGKKLLDRTLWILRLADPQTVVKYGAPNDSRYFNKTYQKAILGGGLRPKRYFCLGVE